jgi:hypothetical protein
VRRARPAPNGTYAWSPSSQHLGRFQALDDGRQSRSGSGRHLPGMACNSCRSTTSNRPETSEFAAKMAKLCDGPPTFRNLDIQKTWEP